MAVNKHLGDRRARLRFQIRGELWASIDVPQDVVLLNITAGGALIEATLSQGMRSAPAASISLPGGGPELMVQVRHVTPISDSPAGDRHLVGIEFVNVTSAGRQAIDAFIERLERHGAGSSDN